MTAGATIVVWEGYEIEGERKKDRQRSIHKIKSAMLAVCVKCPSHVSLHNSSMAHFCRPTARR